MIRLLLLNMAIEPMNNGIMTRHPDALQIWNFCRIAGKTDRKLLNSGLILEYQSLGSIDNLNADIKRPLASHPAQHKGLSGLQINH